MQVTVKPSDVLTDIDGVKVRFWTGQTDTGLPVTLAVHAVILHRDADASQFERELTVRLPPLNRHEEVEKLIDLALSQGAADG